MIEFKKLTPRISVTFLNNKNEKILFEINDRNHLNLGELFTDYVASNIINNELKDALPDEVLIIASVILKKQ